MRTFFVQEILGTPLLRAISWTLIHSLWQGFLFAIVAGIIVMATKRSSAALRYNLLTTLFFLFLLVAGYTFIREWKPGIGMQGSFARSYATGNIELKDLVSSTDDISSPSAIRNYLTVFVNYFNEHASLVVMVWFIFFCARFVKLLANVGYMQRIRHYRTFSADPIWEEELKKLASRLQINKPIQLLLSGLVKVPMVAGFFKPVILFPLSMFSQLSPEQVEAVLLHELAHIRRRDYLVNLLQHSVEIIFFFNPGVLWISSLIREERENCCDDLAIGLTHDNRKFVHALLAFQEYNLESPGLATAFTGKKNHLLARVKRILHHKNQTLNTMEKVFLAGCFFAMTLITVAFSQTHKPVKPAAMAKKDLPATPAIPVQSVAATKLDAPVLTEPLIEAPVPPAAIEESAQVSLAANDTTPSKIATITIEPDDMIIYVKNGYRIVTRKNKIAEAYYHDEKLSDEKLKESKPMLEKLIHEQKMESDAELGEQMEMLALKKSLLEADQDRLILLSQTDMLKEQELLKEKVEAENLNELKDHVLKLKSGQFKLQKEFNDEAVKRQLMLEDNQARNLELLKIQHLNIEKIAAETTDHNQTYIDPILNDLQEAGIIKDQETVSFELTNDRFVVNNKIQSREVFKKFREKYFRSPKDYIKYKADKSKGSKSTSINIDR